MSKAWAIEVQYPDRSRVSGTMFAAPTGPQHAGVQVLHSCIMIVWIGLTLAVPMICSWWSRNKYWTLCFYQTNVFKLWLQSGREKGSRRQLGDWSSRYPVVTPVGSATLYWGGRIAQNKIAWEMCSTRRFSHEQVVWRRPVAFLPSFDCILWQHIPLENRRV